MLCLEFANTLLLLMYICCNRLQVMCLSDDIHAKLQADFESYDNMLVGLICAYTSLCHTSSRPTSDMMTAWWHSGEGSFHSSLSFHKANGNTTNRPREAFVIIFMDQDMTLADPSNEFQHRDRNA